jgi:outer membrane translocation and assembly module TamA
MHYDQLYGSRMRVARCDYRFKYNGYLSFSMMGNIAFSFARRSEPEIGSLTLWGWGFGLVVDSPVGIFELIYALGSKSFLEPNKFGNVTYITLGTRF